MKKTKKVLCSGLAFSDKKDMLKLHKYAKEGWIFREFKGLSYILHNEEPQDLIFDYDIAAIPKEELDEYDQIFLNAGWTPISNTSSDIRFFSAKTGTPLMHTDTALFSEKYKPIKSFAFIIFVVSMIVGMIGLKMGWLKSNISTITTLVMMASSGLAAGSATLFVGAMVRSKGKSFPGSN